MSKTRSLFSFLSVSLTMLLGACSSIPAPQPLQEPEALKQGAVTESPQLEVAVDFDVAQMYALQPKREGSQNLPEKRLEGLSVGSTTVGDALRLIASQAGLSLDFAAAQGVSGPVLRNVSGSLAEVMDTLTKAYGLFWHAAGSHLVVRQDEQFIVQLPPVDPDALEAAKGSMERMGAKDVFLDKDQKLVVMRATAAAQERIAGYLEHIRRTRTMIVYDVDIWQVTLNKNTEQGLDWSALSWTYGGQAPMTGSVTAPADGTLKASYHAGKLDVAVLAVWMRSQGSVKSLSRPRLAVLNGSKGTFSIGQSIPYVAKVGSVVTNGTTQTTVETSKVETGLKLAIKGDVHDGTVVSTVNLELAELLRLQKFQAVGTDLSLPDTATRSLSTIIKARPGDTVLLGGITSGTESSTGSTSFTGAAGSDSATRTELVIAIRPRIVKFNNKE